MKSKVETKYEATRSEVTITCDLCQATAKDGNWGRTSGWDAKHDEVSIERSSHENYPGSGSVEKVIYDCCAACFDSKVRPALEALGLKPREERVDY